MSNSTIVPTAGLTAYIAESHTAYPAGPDDIELCRYPVVASVINSGGDDIGCGEVLIVTTGGVIRPARDQADSVDTVLISVQAEPLAEGWETLAVGRLRNKVANSLFEELRYGRTQSEIEDAWSDIVQYGLDNDFTRELRAKAAARLRKAAS